jgi:hypothetical protein
MLAETSSVFGRIFSQAQGPSIAGDVEAASLPPAPTKCVCGDGSEARLYRMPQLELNEENSLEVLLHATHMHNHLVPRRISNLTGRVWEPTADCRASQSPRPRSGLSERPRWDMP